MLVLWILWLGEHFLLWYVITVIVLISTLGNFNYGLLTVIGYCNYVLLTAFILHKPSLLNKQFTNSFEVLFSIKSKQCYEYVYCYCMWEEKVTCSAVFFWWGAGGVLRRCSKSWGKMKLTCSLKSCLQWFYCLDKEALFWTTHPQFP